MPTLTTTGSPTETSSGGDTIFQWGTAGGSFTATVGGLITVLIIAGGGSGGSDRFGSGGGGAGAMVSTTFTAVAGQTYTVAVGAGGAAVTNSGTGNGVPGNSGSSSGITGGTNAPGTFTGGGFGCGGGPSGAGGASTDGSGGGAGGGNGIGASGGSSGTYGNDGGDMTEFTGAGGGGAGGVGEDQHGPDGADAGDGGIGSSNSITGVAVTYAAGGGGSANVFGGGSAGLGTGPGGDGNQTGAGSAGVDGTGSGGGGSGGDGTASGKGGDGTVIVRFTPEAAGETFSRTTSISSVSSVVASGNVLALNERQASISSVSTTSINYSVTVRRSTFIASTSDVAVVGAVVGILQDRRLGSWHHSLWNNGQTDEVVPYWMDRIADADGGKTIQARGQTGFQGRDRKYDPTVSVGQDMWVDGWTGVTSPGDAVMTTWAQVDACLITDLIYLTDNFQGPPANGSTETDPTVGGLIPDGASPADTYVNNAGTSHLSDVFINHEANLAALGGSRSSITPDFLIQENILEASIYFTGEDPATATASDLDNYFNACAAGSNNSIWFNNLETVVKTRVGATLAPKVKLVPVASVMASVHLNWDSIRGNSDSALTAAEWFSDADPHGNAVAYLFYAMCYHSFLFREAAPEPSFTGSSIPSKFTNNYSEISAHILSEMLGDVNRAASITSGSVVSASATVSSSRSAAISSSSSISASSIVTSNVNRSADVSSASAINTSSVLSFPRIIVVDGQSTISASPRVSSGLQREASLTSESIVSATKTLTLTRSSSVSGSSSLDASSNKTVRRTLTVAGGTSVTVVGGISTNFNRSVLMSSESSLSVQAAVLSSLQRQALISASSSITSLYDLVQSRAINVLSNSSVNASWFIAGQSSRRWSTLASSANGGTISRSVNGGAVSRPSNGGS